PRGGVIRRPAVEAGSGQREPPRLLLDDRLRARREYVEVADVREPVPVSGRSGGRGGVVEAVAADGRRQHRPRATGRGHALLVRLRRERLAVGQVTPPGARGAGLYVRGCDEVDVAVDDHVHGTAPPHSFQWVVSAVGSRLVGPNRPRG